MHPAGNIVTLSFANALMCNAFGRNGVKVFKTCFKRRDGIGLTYVYAIPWTTGTKKLDTLAATFSLLRPAVYFPGG